MAGHLAVACPHDALLDLVLLNVLVLDDALGAVHVFRRRSAIQEAEAAITQTRVAVKLGELHCKLLLLLGLELGDVEGCVQHPELEVAVEAAVRTRPLRVDLEGARLLRHNCRESLGPVTESTNLERIIIKVWIGSRLCLTRLVSHLHLPSVRHDE